MNENREEICSQAGRPVAQDSTYGDGNHIELWTHSETIILGDDHARELIDEMERILDGKEEK